MDRVTVHSSKRRRGTLRMEDETAVLYPEHPAIVTLEILAAELGRDTRTVSRLVRNGRLPGVLIGRQYRMWHPAVLATLREETYSDAAQDDPWAASTTISTATCARGLGLASSTIRSCIDSGDIPATRLGPHWAVLWPDLRDRIAGTAP